MAEPTDPLEQRIDSLLAPARDQGVSAILEAMAQALDAGAEVEPEPMHRDADGKVVRGGPLDLPWRGDLLVHRAGRSLPQQVESGPPPDFPPLSLVGDGGFTVVVAPFPWEAAEVIIESRQKKPNWQPIRLWFLEWMQSRYSDVSPDLFGAVHRIEGPEPQRWGWRFQVDFGSAPTAAVSALMVAAAETGASRLRIADQEM